MPRGNAGVTKVHYKGKEDDFIVIVESADAVRTWKNDKSVPLAQVLDGFKIFGLLDTASKQTLDAEFGTTNEDDILLKILDNGDIVESEAKGRTGNPNMTKGGSIAH